MRPFLQALVEWQTSILILLQVEMRRTNKIVRFTLSCQIGDTFQSTPWTTEAQFPLSQYDSPENSCPPPPHTHIFFPKPLHLLPSSCPQDLRASPVALQHRARGRDASRSEVQMSGPPLPFSSPSPLARPAALPTIIAPINRISPPPPPTPLPLHPHAHASALACRANATPESRECLRVRATNFPLPHAPATGNPVPLVHAPALIGTTAPLSP